MNQENERYYPENSIKITGINQTVRLCMVFELTPTGTS
jgi:hypothetical protein